MWVGRVKNEECNDCELLKQREFKLVSSMEEIQEIGRKKMLAEIELTHCVPSRPRRAPREEMNVST